MTFAALTALLVWALAIFLMLMGTWWTLKHFRTAPPHLDAPFALYPVSILKPFKGKEPGFRENIASFFKLDYPDFEIHFSAAEENDPGVPVVRELLARYPAVRARLTIGAMDIGPNPKVNNLLRSYQSARHDWILISDSNVRVEPSALRRLVAHLEPGVGLVTAVVAGSEPRGIGGYLEAAYLNTFYSRGMITAARLGKPCVVGKCMLFRRSTAERFGGIRNLGRYLAEDYMAGEAMRKLGLKVIIAADPVQQPIGRHSLEDFWLRHIRWGRIRKVQAPLAFAIEPLLGSLVSCGLGAWAFQTLLGINPTHFLLAHLTLWSACDLLLLRAVRFKLKPQIAIAWFLREALALPLWLHIASGNTVKWRGNRLKLLPGGILESHT